jgi:hypothetical protein
MAPNDNPPAAFGSPHNSASTPAPGGGPPGSFQLPIPPAPEHAVDPEVYNAWKKYMKEGFEHNNEMFKKVLEPSADLLMISPVSDFVRHGISSFIAALFWSLERLATSSAGCLLIFIVIHRPPRWKKILC